MGKQIKSKKRVSEHGEVFTSEREVSAMLDLVQEELKQLKSTVLEPACGTGNFLVEILKRKMIQYKASIIHSMIMNSAPYWHFLQYTDWIFKRIMYWNRENVY